MFSAPLSMFAINTNDTRMLTQPAISADHIAFIYAEDLWVANIDGSQPKRLTVDEGVESNPFFSPDGKLIAFSAQYEGNTDVYVLPVEGGIPKRLTWHPGNDYVRGFTKDGNSVLFISQRASFTRRYFQLFTVPVTGGRETQLEIPNAFNASYSPNGQEIAYTPFPEAFRQWKHYRGGMIENILLFSFADKSVIKIPQPAEGCNDTQPLWIGNTIYFRSDRNGEFNLFSYDILSKQINQLTAFKDFPVLNVSGENGKILFEQAGYLHIFDINGSASKKLTIGIAADLLGLRPRFVKGAKYIRFGDISPSGSRAVFDFRGEIITVPAEKGDYRNITNTTGAHEKYPAWSPDGKSIAYFSDQTGEYELYIQSQDGKGDIKKFKLNGTGFYAYPRWSADSKKIDYVDNGCNLYILDLTTGGIQKVDTDEIYTADSFRDFSSDWSFDSKWIAYSKVTATLYKRIYLYNTEQKKSYPLTDGLSDVSEPRFDRNGRFLYFFASTDAGPIINWEQSSIDFRSTNTIYLVTLQNKTLSPFAKESDEENIQKEDTAAKKKDSLKAKPVEKTPDELKIDWDNIQNRIVDIPIKAGNYMNLNITEDGSLIYINAIENGSTTLHKYDFKKRKDNEVMELSDYDVSADGKKMLYTKDESWGIVTAGEKPESGKGMLNLADIQVKIDPLSEWAEIFDEAWRINRDYFYDPGMHGVNWAGMKTKYAVFLPNLSCRSDLNRLMQWLGSELMVGHHFILGLGDQFYTTQPVKGGLLGVDYSVANGRYRFKKIYGGLNWNPELKSPLTEPGVNAREGDYLISVNGDNVTSSDDVYQYFENTAGKIVELTIGPNPGKEGSRVVTVVPIENEIALRNRDWVEGNLRKVTEATKGQVAYVYVPNTAKDGHDYFKRYFYPQANRKAIIVDERFNEGGDLADYYINLLLNPYQAYWHMRYGKDLKTPSASIQGPKVMITDETAVSGGDMLPWMFRKFKVGTLVGKRTFGALVGIMGFPEFIDGGNITAPNLAIWTEDGFIVENVGVSPDIEVEQTPSDVINGKDPQLEKAIEVALKELEKNPPADPVRPPYPIKAGK